MIGATVWTKTKRASGAEPSLAPFLRSGRRVRTEPVRLCTCMSVDMSDELKINMLEAYGIPCLKAYPGDGGFGKLILGMSGQGVDILVPKSMYEDAVALCNEEGVVEDD